MTRSRIALLGLLVVAGGLAPARGLAQSARPAPDRAVGITAGDGQVCAWTRRGRVFCWGNDRYGGVGGSTATCGSHPCAVGPVEVPVRDVVEVRATLDGTCARRRSGEVVCWGLLAGGTGPRVTAIRGERLEARRRGICAIRSGHPPDCVGGDVRPEREPARAATLPSGVEAPRGPGSHACIVSGGRVSCWGSCNGGPCGPALTTMVDAPTRVEALGPTTMVALGNRFTCALGQDGSIACFGDDRAGALGDGSATRGQGIVRVSLPLEAAPPPERVETVDTTAPILHVCDAATSGITDLTRLALRAYETGGAPVDAYLGRMRGNTAAIAADARAADPARCAALLRLLEGSR